MPLNKKYTDEYLKKILLDKVKELGRTPKLKEVPHGTLIAQRLGNGSYDKVVKQLGLQPNISKYNKKYKDDSKLNFDKLTYIEIYNLVLKGEISRFPRRFWQKATESELRELLKYFFEEVLNWTIEDIKNHIEAHTFNKYKLSGMFQTLFEGSPFKVVDFTYPNKIKEWELGRTAVNFWTVDKCIEVTKDILQREHWTEEDIKNKPIYPLFVKYKVTTIYTEFFNGSSYNLINKIYPNKFKPWETISKPRYYWNIETGKEAIKWMIEEKLKWSDEDIKEKYNSNTFKQFKLASMLDIVFNNSPFKAINATYPNRFDKKDFDTRC